MSLPGSIRASKNKGSRVLLLPMTEELHSILSAWIADNPGKPYDTLLRRANGRPYTRTTLERYAGPIRDSLTRRQFGRSRYSLARRRGATWPEEGVDTADPNLAHIPEGAKR
jgi:hypothetical protein